MAELDDLRQHWGDAYIISGTCMAMRRDTGDLIVADDLETLRNLIRRDYLQRPVTLPMRPCLHADGSARPHLLAPGETCPST